MNSAPQYGAGISIKRAGVSETGTFTGYGSTFGGSPDLHGDVIAPGAFAESLSRHKAAGTMPALLWAHDMGEPIGKYTAIKEDQHGLAVTGSLTMGVQRARDAHALLMDGALWLSIGFFPRKSVPGKGGRVFEEVELLEVSLVPLAANPRAVVTSAKSIKCPRDLEEALRTLGYSARESKRLVAGGWSALSRDPSPELSTAARRLREAAAQLNQSN